MGTSWTKAILIEKISSAATRPVPAPVAAMANFRLVEDRQSVLKAVTDAMANGRASLSLSWRDLPDYSNDRATIAALDDVLATNVAGRAGVRIFQLRKILKEHADALPVMYFLADALCASGQEEEGTALLIRIVQIDQGRTELAYRSLLKLSETQVAAGKPLAAIYCSGVALSLDRDQPATLARLQELLEQNGFATQARQVESMARAHRPLTSAAVASLPTLAAPVAGAPVLDAESLYARAAPSVVLLHAGDQLGYRSLRGQTRRRPHQPACRRQRRRH